MPNETLSAVRDWELPPGARTLRVNGYDMAYVEKGVGTPALFVHGAATDYRYFAAQMEPFAVKYRAIAVSLRHYYPEPWKDQGEFTLRQQVADLVAFIRELRVAQVHLIGQSRGGTAAIYATRAAPDLVRTLTFAEGGLGMPAFMPAGAGGLEDRKATYRAISERFNQGDIEGGLETFASYVNGLGAWRTYPEPVKQWARDNAWTLVSAERDQWDPFTCEDAKRIDVPVLLLGGDKSPPKFGKVLDNVQRCLKRSERTLIRDSSHSMPRMNPAGFNEAVLEFLAKH